MVLDTQNTDFVCVCVSCWLPPSVCDTRSSRQSHLPSLYGCVCVFPCYAGVTVNLHPDRVADCQADEPPPQGFTNILRLTSCVHIIASLQLRLFKHHNPSSVPVSLHNINNLINHSETIFSSHVVDELWCDFFFFLKGDDSNKAQHSVDFCLYFLQMSYSVAIKQ